MKNILVVVFLLIMGVLIYVDIIHPVHEQREHYDKELQRYANGISA